MAKPVLTSKQSDIDPALEDAATAPRQPAYRTKAEPNAAHVAEKRTWLARALKRPLPPAMMFEHDGEGYAPTSVHSDPEAWDLALGNAFATRSSSVIRAFTQQLTVLCTQAWDEPNGAWKPNETEMNCILAMVADIQPRSIAEASLAAQMAAIHLLTMRLAAQALNNRGQMVLDRDAALAGKMARTFAQQLETLQLLRGKQRTTRQSITVSRENHIHYHDHRGDQENGRQPLATGQRAALPSPDEIGGIVPLPSRPRKARV